MMELPTAKQYWHALQHKFSGVHQIIDLANRAESAGLTRADMNWLAHLNHEPTQEELDDHQKQDNTTERK